MSRFLHLKMRSPRGGGRSLLSILVAVDRIIAVKEDDAGRTWIHLALPAGRRRPAHGEPLDELLDCVMVEDSFPDVVALLGDTVQENRIRPSHWPTRPPGWLPDGTPVETLGFSTRTGNCLSRAGVSTLGDLCERNARDLLDLKNFGQGCLAEVEEKLGAHGCNLVREELS